MTNGSLGETSALACLIGGLYLCIRRTASWEIPVGVLLAAAFFGGIANLANPGADWTVLHHLLGGSLLFGAFFIATDPVSSPMTPKGKFIFGIGVGALIMLLSAKTTKRDTVTGLDEFPDAVDQPLDNSQTAGCAINPCITEA